MYKLRGYQNRAVKDALQFVDDKAGRAAVIVQPTGAGKSLVIANIAKQLNEPVLVIQPSKELLKQNYEKFCSYGETASIFSASMGVKEIGRSVTFATPHSISKHPQLIKDNSIKVVIVDECHYGSSVDGALNKFCKNAGIKKIIGLTATPVLLANGLFGSELRMLNRTKKSLYNKIIHVTQISELTEKGFWTELIYNPVRMDTTDLRLNSSGSEYRDESVRLFYEKNLMQRKVVEACDNLIEEGRNSILVFCSLVDEAKKIQQQMKDYAVVIWGDMKDEDRERDIARFKRKEVSVAINVNVLATGFDFPEIDGCVHARPTNSLSVYYQHLGRLVRTHPAKKDAKIVDLSSNYFRFGKLEEIRIEDLEKTNGWCMMKKGDKIITAYSTPDVTTDYKPKLKKKVLDCKTFKVPFGKYKDKTLDNLPKSYLEWITSDKFEAKFQKALDFKTAASLYLHEMYPTH